MLIKTKRKKGYIKIVVVILLLLLLFLLSQITSIYAVLLPIQDFFFSSATNINNKLQSVEKVRNVEEIIKENDELKIQKNELLQELSSLKIYKDENKVLKEKLGFFETKLPDRNYAVARVVAKDINNPSLLSLNRGRKDGIIEGLPVIVGAGSIVAKITEVSEYSSKALLLRDSQSSLAAKVLDKGTNSNLVVGKYGLSIRIELIPQDINLEIGDIVITSGIEENIPEGLLIGTIEKIEASPSELFKEGIVGALVLYDDINLVSVLLPE